MLAVINKQWIINVLRLTNSATNKKIEINGWIEETISGTKAYNKRELGKLLKKVQKDDIIICSELSRGENASRRKPRSEWHKKLCTATRERLSLDCGAKLRTIEF